MDNISDNIRSWGLGLMVALLCVIFILQFGGPQAQGCTLGGGASYAAKVYGETITDGEFKGTYALAGFDGLSNEDAERSRLKELTMDGLVERGLLAHQADEVGMVVEGSEVWQNIIDDSTAYVSIGITAPPRFQGGERPLGLRDRDGEIDLERAKTIIQFGLHRSVKEFEESQVLELEAQRMRQVLASTLIVSPREVWEAFVRERESVTLKYVRFSPAFYRRTLEPTDADVRAWMAENETAVNDAYEARRHRYTGLEKQVRSRHILIKIEDGASDEVKAAARARAQAIHARAAAGADFAALARETSEDEDTAPRGGDLGYRVRGRMPAAFDEAQFGLEAGAISDVVETRFGYHVIKVEGIREGDVPEDEAKLEISQELFRERRAESLAEEAATRALTSLRGGSSMDDLEAELLGRPGTPVVAEGDEAEEPEEPEDPLAPRVRETRPFGRSDTPIPGVAPGPILEAAWALTEESPLPSEPIRVGTEYLVVRLEAREEASRDDFDDTVRRRITDGLLRVKTAEADRVFLATLRSRAQADGAIRVNEAIIEYGSAREEEAEEEAPPPSRRREGEDQEDEVATPPSERERPTKGSPLPTPGPGSEG